MAVAIISRLTRSPRCDGAGPTVAAGGKKHPALTQWCLDGAYAGGCAQHLAAGLGLRLEVVRHPAYRVVGHGQPVQSDLFDPPAPGGFVVLPKRWVVERTHAWLERSRRLVMHQDRSIRNATAWIWLAQTRIPARRLTSPVA